VVHVTTPNHAHYEQVKAILAAGKNVVCEKPLAMTSEQSAEMVEIAKASGKLAAVCYNIRFYPLNQQAHGMVQAGELGDIRFVTGHYHQDWLAKPTDWNWRLESEMGGALRSVGDIGTHWVDLTGFVTGLKPQAVMAELATFLPERQKPTGPVETFSSAAGATETREDRHRRRRDDRDPLRKRRARRDEHQPDQRRAARTPCTGTWRGPRPARPGTARRPITCSSGIAMRRTRC
jgi:predicted dehydrogenase